MKRDDLKKKSNFVQSYILLNSSNNSIIHSFKKPLNNDYLKKSSDYINYHIRKFISNKS